MKPDVYVSKAAHVEGFPKSFEKIGGTISGQNWLSLTNIYYYVEKLNCIIVLIWHQTKTNGELYQLLHVIPCPL